MLLITPIEEAAWGSDAGEEDPSLAREFGQLLGQQSGGELRRNNHHMFRQVPRCALAGLFDQELGDAFRQGLLPGQEVKRGQGGGLALWVLRHGGTFVLPDKLNTATSSRFGPELLLDRIPNVNCLRCLR